MRAQTLPQPTGKPGPYREIKFEACTRKELVASDASTLIGLASAKAFDLLHQLFGQVAVTATVQRFSILISLADSWRFEPVSIAERSPLWSTPWGSKVKGVDLETAMKGKSGLPRLYLVGDKKYRMALEARHGGSLWLRLSIEKTFVLWLWWSSRLSCSLQRP